MNPSESLGVNPEELVEVSLDEPEQRRVPGSAGLVHACAEGHGGEGKHQANVFGRSNWTHDKWL